MVRHMFPGANTPDGFYSYFDNIMPPGAGRTIIIKGGSGTGKSTLMKRVGEYFEKTSAVDCLHCTNDPDSLDGVAIPGRKLAVIDGTAPHVCDPYLPGCFDEIINVARHIKPDIREFGPELVSLQKDKKLMIQKGYNFLKAASNVYANNAVIYENEINILKLNAFLKDFLKIFEALPYTKKEGAHKKMFATALTPAGLRSHLDSLITQKEVYILLSESLAGTHLFLDRILAECRVRDLKTEGFYSPLDPRVLEHLIIPEMNVAFTTKNSLAKSNVKGKKINFLDFYYPTIKKYKEELKANKDLFLELLYNFMDMASSANILHGRIEEIYMSNMRFEGIEEDFEYIINL